MLAQLLQRHCYVMFSYCWNAAVPVQQLATEKLLSSSSYPQCVVGTSDRLVTQGIWQCTVHTHECLACTPATGNSGEQPFPAFC